MVHWDGAGGTLLIDLRLGKLGRYKRASGTTDPRLHADVVRTIRLLRDQYPPRWEVLALLMRGELSPLELHDAFVRGQVDRLPTADDLRPIDGVARRWLAGLDLSPVTIRGYAGRLATLPVGTLGDLPRLLDAARTTALACGKRRTFNQLFTACHQMLVQTLGARHRLVEQVERLIPLRVTRRPGNPQTPLEVRTLADALHEHGAIIWALALSGMRRSEYFNGRWRLLPDRINIQGTKSVAARRDVPRVYPISEPTCIYDHFVKLLRKATKGHVRPHDLRYTYFRWLEDAGVSRERANYYAGHATQNVSEMYRRGRGYAEHLETDAERLRTWLGDPPATGLRVVAR